MDSLIVFQKRKNNRAQKMATDSLTINHVPMLKSQQRECSAIVVNMLIMSSIFCYYLTA